MTARLDREEVSDLVQHWVDAGIITAEQAAGIRADPATAAFVVAARHTAPRESLVAEALGYLGGAIMLVALGLAAGRFWPDLSTAARLAAAAAATALLAAAGGYVPVSRGATADRLRSVMWLLSAAAFSGFLALLATQVIDWQHERAGTFAAVGTALLSSYLWMRHRRLLQQLAVIGSLVVAAGMSTALLPGAGTAPAASVWAVRVAWYVLAWGGVVRPRRDGELVGAVVAGVGATWAAGENWGAPLALVTLAVLAVLAVRLRDLPMLAITAAATLIVLPAIVTHYFPGVLSAAVVLLSVGALLVAAAVLVVRRRAGEPAHVRTGWNTGTPRFAIPAAGLVVGLTAGCVILAALTRSGS